MGEELRFAWGFGLWGFPLLFFTSCLFSDPDIVSSVVVAKLVPFAQHGSNSGCLTTWGIVTFSSGSVWGLQLCWWVPFVAGTSAPLSIGCSGAQSLGSVSWSPFNTREVRSLSLSWLWLLWLWLAIFWRTPSCSVAASWAAALSINIAGSLLMSPPPFRTLRDSGSCFMLIGLAGSGIEGRELPLLSIPSNPLQAHWAIGQGTHKNFLFHRFHQKRLQYHTVKLWCFSF